MFKMFVVLIMLIVHIVLNLFRFVHFINLYCINSALGVNGADSIRGVQGSR